MTRNPAYDGSSVEDEEIYPVGNCSFDQLSYHSHCDRSSRGRGRNLDRVETEERTRMRMMFHQDWRQRRDEAGPGGMEVRE